MRKKLIFILGSQRSGTTALEYILSTNPQLHTLGEVMLLEEFICNNPQFSISKGRCTCGVALSQCDFWQPVLEAVCVELNIDTTELRTNVISGNGTRKELIKHLNLLYEEAYKQADNALLDSSKSLEYLLLINEALPDWDIKVVRISRDPFEVVSSVIKWRERVGRKKKTPFYFLYQWMKVNRQVKRWVQSQNSFECIEVKYEEFISNYKELIPSILRQFGCSDEYATQLSLRDTHTVAGTPTRFEKDIFELSVAPITNAERDFPLGFRTLAAVFRNLYA